MQFALADLSDTLSEGVAISGERGFVALEAFMPACPGRFFGGAMHGLRVVVEQSFLKHLGELAQSEHGMFERVIVTPVMPSGKACSR